MLFRFATAVTMISNTDSLSRWRKKKIPREDREGEPLSVMESEKDPMSALKSEKDPMSALESVKERNERPGECKRTQ